MEKVYVIYKLRYQNLLSNLTEVFLSKDLAEQRLTNLQNDSTSEYTYKFITYPISKEI